MQALPTYNAGDFAAFLVAVSTSGIWRECAICSCFRATSVSVSLTWYELTIHASTATFSPFYSRRQAPITGDISAHDRYIKQLLQYIGKEFNEQVKQEKRVNGVIETQFKPKYKLINSHTCRRTFATETS